eukprot:50252_1
MLSSKRLHNNKNADHPPELIPLKSTESDNNYHLKVGNFTHLQNQWTSIKANSSLLSFLSKFTTSKRHLVYKSTGINKAWDTIRYGIFKMPNSNLNPFVRTSLIRASASAEKSPDKSSSNAIETTLPIYNGGNNVQLRKCDGNTYEFDLKISEWLTSWLSFEVWDENILTHSDSFIGVVSIHISEIKQPGQRYYTQLPLIDRDNNRMVGMLHVKAIQKLKPVNISDYYVLEVEILAITNMTTFKVGSSVDKKKFWCQLFGFLVYLLFYALIMFVAELHTDTGMNEYKDSIWFVLVTMTTVGYGDIYAQTSHSKILNSFFIFFNIFIVVTLVVNLLGYISDSVAESLNNRLDRITTNPRPTIDIIQPAKLKLIELTKLDYESKHTFQIKIYVNVCLFLLILLFGFFTLGVAVLLTGPNFLTSLPYPGYDCDTDYNSEYCSINTDDSTVIFIDSLYYTIASMSFVGYGDIYPKPSAIARILGSIFILFAAMMIIRLLCLMSGYMIWQHNNAHSRKQLGYILASSNRFEWDVDAFYWNYGRLGAFEFLVGMLTKKDVDIHTIDKLMTTFHENDTEGNGIISRENLRAFTKKIRDKLKKDKAIAKYGEDGWNELTNEWKSIKEKQQQLKIEKKQLEREKWQNPKQ